MATQLDPIDDLHSVSASDVKKQGWRGVTRALQEHGAVLVTNHDRPEAVIVSAEAYTALVVLSRQEASRTESALDELRRRFDDRLGVLRAPATGARLRSAMRGGSRLKGKVKAGSTY